MDISGQVIWMSQSTNRIPSVPSSSKIWAMACIYIWWPRHPHCGHRSPPLRRWIWSCQLFVSKPLWLLLVEFPCSYQLEEACRKLSFPTEKGVKLISADFWSTQLFLLGLFLFILSSCLDSRKLFRIYVNCRGRRGKFADQNIAGSFFLSRNTWS